MRARDTLQRGIQAYRSSILPCAVFITGACVLIIELIATRILSPFFGNTIYTVSSIVGVVLAALSIGYYAGGRLSDRWPNNKLFFALIAAGGISTLLLQAISLSVLPYFGRTLSLSSGPLIASSILFLLPSLLLGMLSPFAIKLQHVVTPEKGIGTVAGEMFFWSTLGSIAGSLSTGFVLTPHFGVDHIVLGTGFILLALGLIPLAIMGSGKLRTALGCIAVIALLFAVQLPTMAEVLHRNEKVMYSKDGVYEKLSIIDGTYNGRPTRFFQQDRSLSGAMYLNSDEPVFDYTKYYSLYKVFKPDTKQALVIGGGAYTIPKALLHNIPDAHVDVSEIEPSLYSLGRQYFRVPSTPRLVNHTEDGRRLLQNTDTKYDMIFSDVYYSLYSIPRQFTTREFFQLAKSRLSTNGIFMANLIGDLSRQSPSLLLSEMRTFQQAFPNSYFFATVNPDSENRQNIIFVGQNSDAPLNLRAPALVSSSDPIIRNLASMQIDPIRFNLSQYPVLTDDYAPVEYMTSKVLTASTQKQSVAGQNMMDLIRQQLSYGPRYIGSSGHTDATNFIAAEAAAIAGNNGKVTEQRWQEHDTGGKQVPLTNIMLSLNPDKSKRLIIGTHYDSKRTADMDKRNPTAPVPGADDSASGVAVLLQSAHELAAKSSSLPVGIDYVFFDGEEGLPATESDTPGWKPFGAQHFANTINQIYPGVKPVGGIIIDMVCDRNLDIRLDKSSRVAAASQTARFWQIGNQVSPGSFLPAKNDNIEDDHTPLNQAGIPSFVVIDFDFPAHHTTADTIDKCSAHSLNTVLITLDKYVTTL